MSENTNRVVLEAIGALRSEMLGGMGTLRSDVAAEIGALRGEVGTLRSEVGALRGEVGTLQTEVGTLRSEHLETRTAIMGRVDRVQESVEQLRNEMKVNWATADTAI